MAPVTRSILKWAARIFAVLLAVFLMYLGVLFFPGPLFPHKETFGTYRVYSDRPISPLFSHEIENLDRRLRAMDPPPPEANQRIYLCEMPKYRFFTFLTRRSPESLAIGLSVANESFVSIRRVERFAAASGGVFRHSRFEGRVSEVVAHEIAHFNSVHALGFRRHLRQPLWKSEGWAEYQANLAAIRADPDYDLVARIDLLLDSRHWGDRHGMARFFWESQLFVEYLGEVEGFTLEQLVREDVTEQAVRERMMAWYDGQPGG